MVSLRPLAFASLSLVLACTSDGPDTDGSGGDGDTTGQSGSGSVSGGADDAGPGSADDAGTGHGSSGAGPTSADGGDSTGTADADGSGTDGTDEGSSSDGIAGETSNPDAPGPVESLRASPADAAVFLEWLPPADADYAGVVLLRQPDAAIGEGPTDGAELQIGDTIGDAEVMFVGEGQQRLDAPLVNGTTYHYRVYAFDADHNYSVGAPADATPRASLPAGFDEITFDLTPYAEGAKAVREPDGTIHAAILGWAEDAWEIHYARCDAPCTDPADWSSVLVDEDASDMTPAISLDADGRPWLAYRAWDPVDGTLTRAATCDAGCDATVNWSVVPIGTNGGGGGSAILLAHDPDGRAMLVTNQPMVMHTCEDTCTGAANWTHETIAGDWHALGELVIADDGRMTIASSTFVTQYHGQYRACAGGCDQPDDWSLEQEWNLGGNSGPLPLVRFGPGASQWAMSSTQIVQCDDCFPEYPGQYFSLVDLDATGSRFRLTPWGQPRVVGASSGSRAYLACDYACDDAQHWSQMPVPSGFEGVLVDAWLDAQELPVILEVTSGNLRVYASI